MKEVQVDDVAPPAEPAGEIDALIDYLAGDYQEKRKVISVLLSQAKELGDKGTLVELVYEALLFRSETDEWFAFATQILEEAHGDQLGVAHEEQANEAKERGSSRPLSKVVEARAEQFTAPLRRAVSELRANRDFLDKILFWAQAQPKLIRDEEYGSLIEARHVPEGDPIKHPPSLAKSLRRMR